MKLDLETRVAKKGDETAVTASLCYTGTEPAKLLLEFMLPHTFAVLRDAEGKEIPPSHNAAAARGARFFQKALKDVRVLKPGEAVEVATLSLSRSRRSVLCGDLSWDPEILRSDTLTAEPGYEVNEGHAKTARELDQPEITVGRWTTKLVTPTLTRLGSV